MTGLTDTERRHIEDLGADVAETLEERLAIMVHDGHVPERHAWRLAYERACQAHGFKPTPPQGLLFAGAA